MATAKRREVKCPKPPTEIVLTLSEDEALLLRTIAYKVGGSPAGPRGFMDAIDDALKAVGVAEIERESAFLDDATGSIYFGRGA